MYGQSHEFKTQHFKVRVSNPTIMADVDLKASLNNSNARESSPFLHFEVSETCRNTSIMCSTTYGQLKY